MTHKKAIINKVEIPAALEQAANRFHLTIDTGNRLFYYLRDVNTSTPLKAYRPYVLAGLTAAQLEADITAAIDNYQPRPADMPMNTRRRSPITGHFR